MIYDKLRSKTRKPKQNTYLQKVIQTNYCTMMNPHKSSVSYQIIKSLPRKTFNNRCKK